YIKNIFFNLFQNDTTTVNRSIENPIFYCNVQNIQKIVKFEINQIKLIYNFILQSKIPKTIYFQMIHHNKDFFYLFRGVNSSLDKLVITQMLTTKQQQRQQQQQQPWRQPRRQRKQQE